MRFEWDEEKNRTNINKHGISFRIAARVFLDENLIVIPDEAHSAEEDRYIAIGRIERVLYVVFTEIVDSIRIISARRATKYEETLYYDNI